MPRQDKKAGKPHAHQSRGCMLPLPQSGVSALAAERGPGSNKGAWSSTRSSSVQPEHSMGSGPKATEKSEKARRLIGWLVGWEGGSTHRLPPRTHCRVRGMVSFITNWPATRPQCGMRNCVSHCAPNKQRAQSQRKRSQRKGHGKKSLLDLRASTTCKLRSRNCVPSYWKSPSHT